MFEQKLLIWERVPIRWYLIYFDWTIMESEAKNNNGSISSCKKLHVYDFGGGEGHVPCDTTLKPRLDRCTICKYDIYDHEKQNNPIRSLSWYFKRITVVIIISLLLSTAERRSPTRYNGNGKKSNMQDDCFWKTVLWRTELSLIVKNSNFLKKIKFY